MYNYSLLKSCLCIQDVILPRVLDDQTFATINSIMLFNNVSVSLVVDNHEWNIVSVSVFVLQVRNLYILIVGFLQHLL